MPKPIKHVAVTGGAGQIAYQLLFRIANGDMLGADQPIALYILELPQMLEALKGVQMELEDCAFPLLKKIHVGSDPKEVFQDVDYALLVGAKPRGPGMERGDLLRDNAEIFKDQGIALNEVASSGVKVLVVGNPCNTNCLIAMNHAPRIPKKNFHAMTRLDQNRATSAVAKKASVDITAVTNVTIWGNHSATQVPDIEHAKISGRAAPEVIQDRHWVEHDFLEHVQKRGAAIIAARGKSSAASAAHAAIEAVKALVHPSPQGEWFSSAVCTDGNPYGIAEGLVFSFPCISQGNGEYEIVKDLPWNDFLKEKIAITEQELKQEREAISELMIADC